MKPHPLRRPIMASRAVGQPLFFFHRCYPQDVALTFSDRHMMRFDLMPSPVGELMLVASDTHLGGVYFTPHPDAGIVSGKWLQASGGTAADAILARTRAQLTAYFDGTAIEFDLPLGPHGTPFQMRVWEALRAIPHAQTISYGELARRLGAPKAMRAVDAANGRNPIPIIVPCHRVIGARGDLTGFGGGLERKRWLLEHEGGVKELGLRSFALSRSSALPTAFFQPASGSC